MAGKTLEDSVEFVRALFYGPYGSGKTTSAARMACLGKTVFLNVEGGLKKRPLLELDVPLANIQVENLKTYDEIDELFWTMKEELDDDPDAYAGLVIDSGSELVARFLEQVRKDEHAKKAKKAERRGEEFTESRFFNDRSYYGDVTGMVSELVRHFIDLPCHFCVTALPRRDQDDDGAVTYGPAVNPAVQGVLTGLVDVVGYFEAEEDLFTARFRSTKTKQAKDRFGALPNRLVDPFFDRVVAYVNDELDAESDPKQIAAREASKKKPESDETDEEASQQQPRRRRKATT